NEGRNVISKAGSGLVRISFVFWSATTRRMRKQRANLKWKTCVTRARVCQPMPAGLLRVVLEISIFLAGETPALPGSFENVCFYLPSALKGEATQPCGPS